MISATKSRCFVSLLECHWSIYFSSRWSPLLMENRFPASPWRKDGLGADSVETSVGFWWTFERESPVFQYLGTFATSTLCSCPILLDARRAVRRVSSSFSSRREDIVLKAEETPASSRPVTGGWFPKGETRWRGGPTFCKSPIKKTALANPDKINYFSQSGMWFFNPVQGHAMGYPSSFRSTRPWSLSGSPAKTKAGE